MLTSQRASLCIGMHSVAPHHVSDEFIRRSFVSTLSTMFPYIFLPRLYGNLTRDRVTPAATYVGGGDLENDSQSYRDRDSKSVGMNGDLPRRNVEDLFSRTKLFSYNFAISK